jgi:hypothetical protein
MPKNESYFDPLIFAGICIGIPVFIFQIGEMSYFVAIYTGFVFGLVLRLFVSSVIFHILWKAVGGTASFKNTFQIVAYSSALVLFTAIPIDLLSLIIILYTMYLRTRGGQFVHNLSTGRSAAVAITVGIYQLIEGTIILELMGLF